MLIHSRNALKVAALSATAALVVSGCAADTGTDQEEATSGETEATAADQDGTESELDASDGSGPVDLEGARAFLEPFYGPPDEFPETESLTERPDPSTEVVFMKSATTVADAQDESLQAAAEAMGIQYRSIELGGTAESINAALDSVVEMEPDGVLNVSTDPTFFTGQLETLREAGTVVVSGGIVNGDEFGFETVMANAGDVVETGKIMAAHALLEGEGSITNLAYYKTPELQFTSEMERGVREQVEALCETCTLRVVNIPITEVGSTAPDKIVSDLQANPDTDAALASFNEIFLGLPSALEVAGIDVFTMAQAPVASSYEAIENGQQNATVAWDVDLMMWPMMDQLARELTGQELTDFQKEELLVKQVITEDSLPDDFNEGWHAFPDTRERYQELWTE